MSAPHTAHDSRAHTEPAQFVTLTPAQLEELAELVAQRLIAARPVAALVGVREVAAHLGVDEGYVYEHASELGARRLGQGPKARLRFSLAEVDERTSCSAGRGSSAAETTSQRGSRPRRRGGLGTSAPLLPIRGSNRASEAA